jgi:hypothetical protein
VTVEILGNEALLHPFQIIRPQTLGKPDSVIDIEAHPAIEHELT